MQYLAGELVSGRARRWVIQFSGAFAIGSISNRVRSCPGQIVSGSGRLGDFSSGFLWPYSRGNIKSPCETRCSVGLCAIRFSFWGLPPGSSEDLRRRGIKSHARDFLPVWCLPAPPIALLVWGALGICQRGSEQGVRIGFTGFGVPWHFLGLA